MLYSQFNRLAEDVFADVLVEFVFRDQVNRAM